MSPLRRCSVCGRLCDGPRCDRHPLPARKVTENAARRVRNSRRWKALRRIVLVRDGHRCTWRSRRGDRCDVTEDVDVHHVTPIEDGGEPYDPANLQTLCPWHHSRVERDRRREREEVTTANG